MNKAFVREADDTGQRHCPRCGSLGVPVPAATIAALLRAERREAVSQPGYYCPFARCEVVYFDLYERTATTADLLRSVYPKDPDAPLCACFGLTRDDIEADLQEGGVRRVRETVARARTAEAHCADCAPSGQSCVAEVQRYFFKRQAQRAGGSPSS